MGGGCANARSIVIFLSEIGDAMFTGLTERTGTLAGRIRRDGGWRLSVSASFPSDDPPVLGESIAVQGVCLTVDGLSQRGFESDLLDETIRRTTLGALPIGARLNLERAMKANGRFGGHIVQGHVDGTGIVAGIAPAGRDIALRISCGADFARQCVEKGSVAIDGTSLTITAVGGDWFSVAIIPHTLEATSLSSLKPGDAVNLEADIVGKYVARFMEKTGGLTEERLRKAGFDV